MIVFFISYRNLSGLKKSVRVSLATIKELPVTPDCDVKILGVIVVTAARNHQQIHDKETSDKRYSLCMCNIFVLLMTGYEIRATYKSMQCLFGLWSLRTKYSYFMKAYIATDSSISPRAPCITGC